MNGNGNGNGSASNFPYWTKISNEFSRDPLLSPAATKVGVFLASYVNYAKSGGLVWPNNKRISQETGISERHVRRVLCELELRGYILRHLINWTERKIEIRDKMRPKNANIISQGGLLCPGGWTPVSTKLELRSKNQDLESNPKCFEAFFLHSNPPSGGEPTTTPTSRPIFTGTPITVNDLPSDLERRTCDLADDDATRYYGDEGSSAASEWSHNHHGTELDVELACEALGTVENYGRALWDAETNEKESDLRRFRAIYQDPARWWPGVIRRWESRNGKTACLN